MDFIKPFGCNCQNNPSADTCPAMQMQNNTACNKCEHYDEFGNMPLAMAYVPWQTWRNVYDSANGLQNGTIFGELVLPFLCASPVCRTNHCESQRQNQFVNRCDNHCGNKMENRCDNHCGNKMENRCGNHCGSKMENRCDNHCGNKMENRCDNHCGNKMENRCDNHCGNKMENRCDNRCDNQCNMERRCNQR